MSIEKLKAALKDRKIIFGAGRTIDGLKRGEIAEVFLAKNLPKELKDKIRSYDAIVSELNENSEEIALLCKRQHNISVISVLKSITT